MRRLALWSTTTLLAALSLSSCINQPPPEAVTLKVAAADNFEPVLKQLAQAYSDRQPWIKVELHTANTAKLEDDLKNGVAYDLYIPARTESLIALAQKDGINPQSHAVLALNQLVVVAPADSDLRLDYESLTSSSVRQIAVANPNLLLGYLTRQSLSSLHYLPSHEAKPLAAADTTPAPAPTTSALGLPDLSPQATAVEINLEPKLLVVASDAEVLAAVEDGRAQIGITYASYADADKKIHVLSPLPLQTYQNVTYNAAIPRNAPHNDEAWHFLDYLRSAEAHSIMQSNGLLVN